MKICFVYYPGKATQVVPLVAATKEEEEEGEDEDDDNDSVKAFVDNHDKINNNDDNNNNKEDHDHDVVISKEPAPSDDMNSYEASWQECRLKWCLRSQSKERHDAVAGWTEDDEDDRGEGSVGSRGRTQLVRRNPSEKRQACSSDSTGSSQEEQDAAAWAAASARRPKAKPLSRVQSVRHDTAAHRYRTRQRVAAEILDEQRAEASAAAARDLCRSSAAKVKKSLSFRNPAPKKVATGGDRLLRVVSDDDHFNHHHHNNNNNNNDNRQPRRHHDKDKHHSHHHNDGDDQQQYHQQQQLLTVDQGASFVTAATATETTVSPSTAIATAGDSGSGGQDNFAIPRPKLIVPVHTYGLRKRRTGNTISSNRTASDVNAASASSTVASSSGSSSTTTAIASDTKKHHNSCPGKKNKTHTLILYDTTDMNNPTIANRILELLYRNFSDNSKNNLRNLSKIRSNRF